MLRRTRRAVDDLEGASDVLAEMANATAHPDAGLRSAQAIPSAQTSSWAQVYEAGMPERPMDKSQPALETKVHRDHLIMYKKLPITHPRIVFPK
jgi:hypothetical protein